MKIVISRKIVCLHFQVFGYRFDGEGREIRPEVSNSGESLDVMVAVKVFYEFIELMSGQQRNELMQNRVIMCQGESSVVECCPSNFILQLAKGSLSFFPGQE